MSKLIVKATDFAAIIPSLYPKPGYFIIGIDTLDGGFKKMDSFGVITSIGGGNLPFNGNRVVTRPGLPAVNVGSTANVNEFVEKMFFPSQGPLLYMSCDSAREFGASKLVSINYTVVTRSNPVTGIVVDGNVIGPNGANNQSGVVNHTLPDFINTNFQGSATDGTSTAYAAASISWYNKRFAFVSVTDFLDLSQTDAQLSSALNTLTSNAFSFSNSKNGANALTPGPSPLQYMYFAYVLLGNEATPNIIVNTIANNAYKSRDFVYTNQLGYTTTFRILRSGNQTAGQFNISIG